VVFPGNVTFETTNVGTETHELVVIKTNLAADSLIMSGNKVDEEASGETIGEIEAIQGNWISGDGLPETETIVLGPSALLQFNAPGFYN